MTDVHHHDRRCDGCGYLLRGLALGRACPECGAATATTNRADLDGPLSSAPLTVIRAVRRRTIALLGALIVLFVTHAGWDSLVFAPSVLVAPLFIGTALAWLAATIYATRPLVDPQAEWHGFARGDRLRRETWFMQIAWLALAAGRVLFDAGWVPRPIGAWGLLLCALICVGAVFVVVECWTRIAEWARDGTAALLLSWVPWLAAGAVLVPPLFLVAALLTAIALASLVRVQTLSLGHHVESAARKGRRTARERAHWSRA